MQKTRTWKRVGAIMLTIAMLVGMLSVLGGLTVGAATSEQMKFKANFDDLAAIADQGGAFASDATSYRSGYTAAVDKAINAWVDEKFDMYGGYGKSLVRTYLGQSSSTMATAKDTWSAENYWTIFNDGSVKHQTRVSGQMFRHVEKFVPKYDGKAAVLSNFEAKMTVAVTATGGQGQGMVIAFHMPKAGYFHNNGDHLMASGIGSYVALGNGGASYVMNKQFGVAVYDQNNTLGTNGAAVVGAGAAICANTQHWTSAGTVDYANQLWKDANHNMDGEWFAEDNDIVLGTKYDLTVRVVGTKVNVTVAETASGNVLYTREKTLNKAGSGYMAFGSANGANKIYNIEIQELDENGKPVAFGTETGTDEVETFKADFTNLPEVQYYDGAYYYNADHDTADVSATVDMNTDWLTKGAVSYSIDTKDTMLVDYLTSKFRFYYAQEAGNSGRFFRRENVNDFYKDANGNDIVESIKAGYAETGSYTYITSGNVYTPDMGSAYNSPTYVDGIGGSANGRGVANWTLYGNEWLTIYNNKIAGGQSNGGDNEVYRRYNQMVVLGEDGNAASLKNFKLTMGFELKAQAKSNLAIAFRANTEAAHRNFNDRALFAINNNGGYILAGPNDTITKDDTTTMALTDHTAAGSSVVYPHTATTAPSTNPCTLELTVVGDQMTAIVYDKNGNKIVDKTVTTKWLHEGFLTIGGSNDGAYYKDIEITRLDDQGNPVDFNDTGAGYEFGADFNNLVYLKTPSNTMIGESTAANAKYPYNSSDTGDPWYMFDKAESTITNKKVIDYLNSKFDFYGSFEGTFADDIGATGVVTAGSFTNKWGINYYAGYGSYLCATCTKDSGEMMRDNITLVPKDENGKPYFAENVETTFDTFLPDDVMSSVQFSFRSDVVGRVIEGYNKNEEQKVSVVINHRGALFVDGAATTTSAGTTNSKPYRAPFDNGNYDAFTLADGTANDAEIYVRVHIKVLGENVTVKVTSLMDGTELLNKTYTTTWLQSGYMGYTVFHNKSAAFANINLRALAGSGDVISFDQVGDLTTLYADKFTTTYNHLFAWNSAATGDERVPAVLRRASRYLNNLTYFSTLEAGYSATNILDPFTDDDTNKTKTYLASDGYVIEEVTRGEGEDAVVETVLKDAAGAQIVSTTEPGVASITKVMNEEDPTVVDSYLLAFDKAYFDNLVREMSNEMYDYLDSKFEFYYTDVSTYKGEARNNNWGYEPGSGYWGSYIQWRNSSASYKKTDSPVDKNISVLVPREENGAALYGDNFTWSQVIRLSDAGTYGTAYFGFNMPTAGKLGGAQQSNGTIAFDSNVNVIRINATMAQLWNGTGWVDLVAPEDWCAYREVEGTEHCLGVLTVNISVKDGKLTGTIAREYLYKKVNETVQTSVKDSFTLTEQTLTNTNAGYLAYGFNASGVNMGICDIVMKTAKKSAVAEQPEGGNITVERVTSDKVGLFKYKVTAVADEGWQLKANTLLGTDAKGVTVYPAQRVGFRSDMNGGDAYYFYTAEDITFDAEFFTARDVSEANMDNLGTSYNAEKYGLRFISRIYMTEEDGVKYTAIDGEKYEVVDYGMLLAVQAGLDWGTEQYGSQMTLDNQNPYIAKKSAVQAGVHYDISGNYVDVAATVLGLEGNEDMEIISRAYLVVKLADGSTVNVYTKQFASTFLDNVTMNMVTYLDPDNGDDANGGKTEGTAVKTLSKALALTTRAGKIVNKGTVTLPATFGSGDAEKAITLSGGTYKIGARHSTLNSPITFDDTTIEVPDFENTEVLFAAGHKLVVKDTVTMNGRFNSLYGGVYQTKDLERTDLEIYAGNYYNILGGSAKKYVAEAHITVGGNVNQALKNEGESNHNVGIFGGGAEGADTGDTYITFGGNAYAYMIYGGSGQAGTISGDTHVTVNGGEVAQVFGGCDRVSMTGDTNVTVKSGTVTRRIYGGCYNETNIISWGSQHHVTGNTTVTLYEAANITNTGDYECGIWATSRYKSIFNDEISTLIYENEAAKTKFASKLGTGFCSTHANTVKVGID